MEKRLVCVHVCSWGLRSVGRKEGSQGRQSKISLAVQQGRAIPASLPCLFWGNHDAEVREGHEQQVCWTDRAPEGVAGSLETQFLFGMSHMCCVTD